MLWLAKLVNVALYNTDVITMHNVFTKTQLWLQFLPNNSSKFCYIQLGENDSYLYKIHKQFIKAAYYFEITSPIYERNQQFESFKIVYNICHISFKMVYNSCHISFKAKTRPCHNWRYVMLCYTTLCYATLCGINLHLYNII